MQSLRLFILAVTLGLYVCGCRKETTETQTTETEVKEETSIGIDFGVKTFLTLSSEEKIESPKYFKQSQDKLAKHQQELEKLENPIESIK